MRHKLVSYTTRAERGLENQRLIEAVFRELRVRRPANLAYLALRLADGGFVHFVTTETEADSRALTELDAFRAFQAGLRERCIVPPHANEAVVVGYYDSLDASPLEPTEDTQAALG